jgi:hypothetical protein
MAEYNEYEASLRSVSNEFIASRIGKGDTAHVLMFSLLSVLFGKKKITETDLDTILETEYGYLLSDLKEYLKATMGDPTSKIKNDQEFQFVSKMCEEYWDDYKKQVVNTSNLVKKERKKRKGDNNEPTSN